MSHTNAQELNDQQNPSLRYPKPNILLMNVEHEVAEHLKGEGFQIAEGSFGERYPTRIPSSQKYVHMEMPPDFPPIHIAEKDVVIVDLTSHAMFPAPGYPAFNGAGDAIFVYAPLVRVRGKRVE